GRAPAARSATAAAHAEKSFPGGRRAALAARAAAASLSRRRARVGAGPGHRCALQKSADQLGIHSGMAANLLKLQKFLLTAELFWMALERTLSIIKPDAVKKNAIGQILARFEAAGLRVIAARMMHLSTREAEGFYAVHRERPFFRDLVSFMISGPVLVQVLEGESAISRNRELMGATDPKKAAKGTIRADFADSIDANAVHGSDGPETARSEIAYFFPASEIFSR